MMEGIGPRERSEKIGHCLNHPKPSENFLTKEILSRITGRVSKEEHEAALLRIKELERMVETNEDKRIARMQEAVESIISNIKHNVNLYLINNLFDDYETSYEVEQLINDLLTKDFRNRMESRKQMRLL